jgi:hypothetical protein
MSRTIRLTRIHALNWYGYQDTLDVDGNLLLAGVTGSGKSILMDLIQFVLVGDQRAVRFNQSATGDRSDRTLKGYCLGDTKQEEAGVTQYMRESAVTYVALEFTWPTGRSPRKETWGLRVEFISAAEAQGRVTPFLVPARLDRSDYLDLNRVPLDYAGFRAMVESRKGRLYTEGLESYLRDMAQPTHLNFDRGVLRDLLPSAMSFSFLRSFNDFARRFVLASDQLDVRDVTASYRSFLAYERDLTELNDQFNRLEKIQSVFERLQGLKRDRALSMHLESALRLEHATAQLATEEERLTGLRKVFAAEEQRLLTLDSEIPEIRSRMNGLHAVIHETPDGRLYAEIKSRNQLLSREISELSEIGSSLDQALAARVKNARRWLANFRALPLELAPAPASAVERAINAAESSGPAVADGTLVQLKSAADAAAAEAGRAARPVMERLAKIRAEMGELREQIAALRVGKLPFPTRLLDTLNAQLASSGPELPAQPLCKLCEVLDERWRPAVEIAFSRKFAVVVSERHYDAAERIYHSLKASELGAEAGRESLVNPTRALKRSAEVRPSSLATKIRCSHPVAKALVAQMFGDLLCVETLAELRQHDDAILPDGFRSRGAFVERPRFYDGHPFVGEDGLRQQLAWKVARLEELETDERRLRPVAELVQNLNEEGRKLFEVPPSLYRDLAQAAELPKRRAELETNLTRLRTIDDTIFAGAEKQLAALEQQFRRMEAEQRSLLQSEQRAAVRSLESAVGQLRQRADFARHRFEQVRDATDVSCWLTRLDELRTSMLGEYPLPDAAADRFRDRFHACDREAAAAWEEIKALRRELAIAHPRFEDLQADAESNDSHSKQLARLRESDIPDYRTKAERERKHWEGLFRSQVLDKLHGALGEVRGLLQILNQELRKRPIGQHTYQIRHWQNPDYKLYHDLLDASALARPDELFFASAEQKFRDAISNFLRILTEQPDSVEASRLLDYRHYYEYDMEVIEPDGRKTSVDRHSGKFSGGENQSPYFIAILASYRRAYRRYRSRSEEPSLGLVPIDEAFSKLSGERIKDCITALKAFDLQGVFSMSTGNIPYAFEHCDWLIVVSKEERPSGRRTVIRNVAVSLARDSEEARHLVEP